MSFIREETMYAVRQNNLIMRGKDMIVSFIWFGFAICKFAIGVNDINLAKFYHEGLCFYY